MYDMDEIWRTPSNGTEVKFTEFSTEKCLLYMHLHMYMECDGKERSFPIIDSDYVH